MDDENLNWKEDDHYNAFTYDAMFGTEIYKPEFRPNNPKHISWEGARGDGPESSRDYEKSEREILETSKWSNLASEEPSGQEVLNSKQCLKQIDQLEFSCLRLNTMEKAAFIAILSAVQNQNQRRKPYFVEETSPLDSNFPIMFLNHLKPEYKNLSLFQIIVVLLRWLTVTGHNLLPINTTMENDRDIIPHYLRPNQFFFIMSNTETLSIINVLDKSYSDYNYCFSELISSRKYNLNYNTEMENMMKTAIFEKNSISDKIMKNIAHLETIQQSRGICHITMTPNEKPESEVSTTNELYCLKESLGSCILRKEFTRDHLDVNFEIWGNNKITVPIGKRKVTNIKNLITTIFHAGETVMQFASELLKCDVAKVTCLSHLDIESLTKNLSNIKVYVTYLPYRRIYVVNSVTNERCDALMLNHNKNCSETVAKYFGRLFGKLKFPNLPCLNVKCITNGKYIPLEVCCIASDQFKLKQMDRPLTIETCNEDILKQTKNVDLTTDYNTIIGGCWKNKFGHYTKTHTVDKWTVLSFARTKSCCQGTLRHFSEKLRKKLITFGLYLNSPLNVRIFDGKCTKLDFLRTAKNQNVNFAILVLPKDLCRDFREELKFLAGFHLRLVTLCLNETVITSELSYDVVFSIYLKLTPKLGGVYKELVKNPVFMMKPVIILGASISIASRNSLCSSVAGVSGSLDAFPFKHAVVCKLLETRYEFQLTEAIIFELKDLVKQVLKNFYKTLGTFPGKVIFFQLVNSSKDNFKVVIENGIPMIENACLKQYGFIPPITLIAVQKHLTKMPPSCLANNTGGVNERYSFPHFHLPSYHNSSHSEFKPIHYTLLYDENKFESEKLQKLCAHLCRNYNRIPKTIIPAALKYASSAADTAQIYANLCIDRMMDSGFLPHLSQKEVKAINNTKEFEATMFFE